MVGNEIQGNGEGLLVIGSSNTIGGTAAVAANVIAANTGDAVDVRSGSGNAIRGDQIYGNGSPIVLAGTANGGATAPI